MADRLYRQKDLDALIKGEHGRKYDLGKPRWVLLPFDSVEEIVKVLTFGARKYDDENWRRVPDAKRRYISALFRHLVLWLRGEDRDTETGLSHLAHAGCCLLFLMELTKNAQED